MPLKPHADIFFSKRAIWELSQGYTRIIEIAGDYCVVTET